MKNNPVPPATQVTQVTQVYDWPTRFFHWTLAICFASAFFIAKTLDDESSYYPIHMLIGLSLGFSISLRILWGFFGSQYARFSSFQLNPKDLIAYFKKIIQKNPTRVLGHNPASSWAALIMMILGLSLGLTGYLMTTGGDKDFFKEIHELCANLFLITAIAHVAGIVLHTILHRDPIGLSMLHGKKKSVGNQPAIAKTYFGVGLIFLTILTAFVFYLYTNYNSKNQTLNFLGKNLELGESEEHSND